MPHMAKSHAEWMRLICGRCCRKQKDLRTINPSVLSLLKDHHFPNYSLSWMPSVICKPCLNTLRHSFSHFGMKRLNSLILEWWLCNYFCINHIPIYKSFDSFLVGWLILNPSNLKNPVNNYALRDKESGKEIKHKLLEIDYEEMHKPIPATRNSPQCSCSFCLIGRKYGGDYLKY